MNDAANADALLAERLRERVGREGALTFREWMAAALYDERGGYYARRGRERWGRAGDYRTSAERSPLFAAAFARYFAALHEESGAPHAWTILEAGAGRGDFARGVLETLKRNHPPLFSAVSYYVDEESADARERVRARLASFGGRVSFARLAELEPASFEGVIFSNELLDALPVHRVRMRGGVLRELCVGVNADGAFEWVEREPSTPRLASHFESCGVALGEGQEAEVNLEAEEWVTLAASRLRAGYVVTVDYGAESQALYDPSGRPFGTLRAFRGHRFADDPLADPGQQDLTTSVNWSQVRRAGERAGLSTVLFERQDEFLLRAGALEVLERLTREAPDEAARARLALDAREMILPGGMAQSFQVLVQKRSC
ncbi:MAG TPA: SAM-dependent methyltransferase [Pyrinomonadaceae bacterium]|nr:SAM-dependent methyltransferase [Pyrinomonadaceae bacterium]